MRQEGPALEALTRRLAECPPEFLMEPLFEGRGVVRVDAVVGDLLRGLGGAPAAAPPAQTGDVARRRNRLRLILVAAWLLHDESFLARGGLAGPAEELLASGLDPLAELVNAERFVQDPDRREELSRLVLRALGLRPAGESQAQAQDRLSALDSVETRRVTADLRERRKKEEAERRRAEEVRRAMEKKASEQAAAKVSRE